MGSLNGTHRRRFVKVGVAADLLAVSAGTVRNLVANGDLEAFVNPHSSHRLISLDSIREFIGEETPSNFEIKKACIYARKSSPSDRKGLETQVSDIVAKATARGIIKGKDDYEVIQELCSGVNFDPSARRGFFELLEGVMDGKYSTVIVNFPERLSRLPIMDLLRFVFEKCECELIFLNDFDVNNDQETQDEVYEAIQFFMSWIQSFTNKQSAKRAGFKSKKFLSDADISFLLGLRMQGKTLFELEAIANKRGMTWFTREGKSGTAVSKNLIHRMLTTKGKTLFEDFRRFLNDRTVNEGEIFMDKLYDSYFSWCRSEGLHPTSKTHLGHYLAKLGYKSKKIYKRVLGKQVKIVKYFGLSIRREG